MKEAHIKMAQVLEEINRKISTQFKLLALAEKETERSITRNKKSDIDKDLQLAELKLEKLQELQCCAQEFLSD